MYIIFKGKDEYNTWKEKGGDHMKCFLRKSVVVLSMLLLLTICFAMTIHAAGKIPTKCRGNSNSAWNRVDIPLEKEQYIKITSSKGLKTKVTGENYG